MDFFLTGPCPLGAQGAAPDPACAMPYADEEVIDFLENRCGLSRERPLPGAIFDTHDKALDFWCDRMREGALRAPFEVVHVDTHSDLAVRPAGARISCSTAVLSRQVQMRPTLENYRAGIKLDEAKLPAVCPGVSLDQPPGVCAQPAFRQDIPTHILDWMTTSCCAATCPR